MNCLGHVFKQNKPNVIVICGPTATGKTSLSIQLAKKYAGEVISADSRQIYRGLDIGSAKVTSTEMQGIPHHMIDIADPRDIFTVQEFITQAHKIISEIISRGNIPIICGGTGQYIDALVYNKSFPNVPPNQKLRKKLSQLSTQELFSKLQKQDPLRATNIDQHNPVRLVRALEITDALGMVPKQTSTEKYSALFIGLDLPKEFHRKLIHTRIIERLEEQSMLSEARNLYVDGLSFERMESLGLEYRYMARHLQGLISYTEMIQELTTKTVQFAKRQRTWFKRNQHITWFHPLDDIDKINNYVANFLKQKKQN